jgi:phosphotransferase system HPr-like phosphotransfer protein
MKKRILSLILALVLVFGVAVAPSAGVDAASKKTYTGVILKSKQASVKFTIAEAKKASAASSLNKILGVTVKSGKSFAITIDGKKFTATNKSGTIYIGSKKLVDVIKASKKNPSITVKTNIKSVLKLVKLSGKTASFSYTVKIGSATIKNIKVKKGKTVTFKGNGKSYTAVIKSGNIYLKGSHKTDKFVKNLKKAGIVSKVTKKKM